MNPVHHFLKRIIGRLAPRAGPLRGRSGAVRADSQGHAPLVCAGLVYAYRGGAVATDNVGLELKAGEIYCILGPNGAGKTTLIKQIGGALEPSAGSIRVFGHDLATHCALALGSMGMIPQDVGLFSSLTTLEHLTFFAAMKGIPRSARAPAIAEVVATCFLEEIMGKKASQLSLGQQRKTLLAIALLGEPPLLLLDEPTVGLDPVSRRDIWLALEQHRARGGTILLTTHYLDEAERLADRIAMLDHGKIVAVGTLQDYLSQLGKTIRVSFQEAGRHGKRAEQLFTNRASADVFIAAGGFSTYAVAETGLEDVYFHLFGRQMVPT